MMRIALATVGNAIAIWAAARIVGHVDLSHSWWTVILAAFLLTLLNTYVKPVLTVLSIPFIIVTLGIALFFLSMLMLWLTSVIVSGFSSDGFWPLVKATLIVWIVNVVFNALFVHDDDDDRRRRRSQRPASDWS
jgi:putative membrane protein